MFIGNGNGQGNVSKCSGTRQLSNSVMTVKSPLNVILTFM